ncbi:ATP-dependent helicase HrpB [Methylocapsa sp. S129]|uniref:ATP-dependent helicase HrpB n=1 Tax=Methylocapsa sp. S129 TaxID=1641869 RepID=UPI00131EC477|nr:ATP-dependent helicase HrpB [Methylocapsa sp. S129]
MPHAPLPIDAVLPRLCAELARKNRAVLVAPPGAGKTTRVPLALLAEPFASAGRILLLEPRRLAARAAAARMAATLGEEVGETIGLRVRMEAKVSARTRIEVITEGVFTRMILDDPALEGVCAVLFDEFHERSLDADLGLALALDAQAALREDMRLLLMSATLDGARVAALMGDAPLVESEGRAYPVETRYVGRTPNARIEDEVAKVTLEALAAERGSILVFLPGQGEITRTAALLEARVKDPSIDIAPLYGAMDRAAQDRAVLPARPGRRKVALATSIAETSLTIEGVRIVVDSGLARVPRYEPDIGVTRLETQRVSKAGADQRRGRAGRTEPGICYRLWEAGANGALAPFAKPEILSADLSGFLLDLAAWGVSDPSRLAFLDAPPAPALSEGRALLRAIGALDEAGRITEEGKAIAKLALPPRLARMVLSAAVQGHADLASRIAIMLTERGLGGDSVDLTARLDRFAQDRSPRAEDARRLAKRLAQQARALAGAPADKSAGDVGPLLAFAFPDRIAKARGKRGEFLMANGRAGAVEPHDSLSGASYLAVGEIVGRAAAARILLAAPLSLEEIEAVAGASIETLEEVVFDRASAALRARRRRRLGAITLTEQNLPVPADEASAAALAAGLLGLGVARLPWSKSLRQWRDRILFLRRAGDAAWPDLGDEALAASADWLTPYLVGKTSLADFSAEEFGEALRALLPYALARRLDAEAPTHFTAPTGSAIPVDYEAEGGPAIALRVQELFGLAAHPALAGGRVPLTLHLLSPAHRPIQITRDLPGFWRGSWAAVRADLRGRYPRHSWPEDPAAAAPTARAKPRGT